jgi:hypothetical protein
MPFVFRITHPRRQDNPNPLDNGGFEITGETSGHNPGLRVTSVSVFLMRGDAVGDRFCGTVQVEDTGDWAIRVNQIPAAANYIVRALGFNILGDLLATDTKHTIRFQ